MLSDDESFSSSSDSNESSLNEESGSEFVPSDEDDCSIESISDEEDSENSQNNTKSRSRQSAGKSKRAETIDDLFPTNDEAAEEIETLDDLFPLENERDQQRDIVNSGHKKDLYPPEGKKSKEPFTRLEIWRIH